MKPDKLTVDEIFQRERRYTIPLYQRSYVWNREEQWEPLWEDIQKQAQACITDPQAQSHKTHFLGAIVLNVSQIVGRALPRSEVIDGQQRLTTLQLFLAALRDYAHEIGAEEADKLHRLTLNQMKDEESEEAFKVWPTNADRQTFRKVIRAKSLTAIRVEFGDAEECGQNLPRMVQAYLFFRSAIQTFVEEEGDAGCSDRFFGIVQALRTSLQFVVIELESSDDPQVIFETLNARGQPLLPSDLIRNYVFMKTARNASINADYLYETYWRHFDDERLGASDASGEQRFWHINERQGRLTRPRIDLFIFHYLVMKTETDLNIGQLFREFRDWQEEQGQAIETFLADLYDYSGKFKDLVAPAGNERLAVFARRLKSLDTSTVYPLLMYLSNLPREILPRNDFDRIIQDLESYLIRRFVVNETSKNYNRFFPKILVKAKQAVNNAGSVADTIRAELMRSQEPTTYWPDDERFRQGWLSNPIYVRARADRAAMVLRALEEGMRNKRNENVSIPTTLTIEHLLPQKGTLKDYPYAELSQDIVAPPEQYRATQIHTLGNLTLLTAALNTDISNGAFSAKKAAIAADSDLRLNAWIRTDPCSEWNESRIRARAELMFAVAKEIWPKCEITAADEMTSNRTFPVRPELDAIPVAASRL